MIEINKGYLNLNGLFLAILYNMGLKNINIKMTAGFCQRIRSFPHEPTVFNILRMMEGVCVCISCLTEFPGARALIKSPASMQITET